MGHRTAGVVAGLLAGAAGATAHNATSYLVQLATASSAPASPTGGVAADTAAGFVGDDGSAHTSDHGAVVQAAGPLGGIGIGLGVGAVAGALRSDAATPPQPLAAVALGAAAWGVSLGASTAAGAPRDLTTAAMLSDAAAHLAYGIVTVLTLHRLLDPRTPHRRR